MKFPSPSGFAAALMLSLGLLTAAGSAVGAAPDPRREVLVLLRLPPAHYHPGGEYADAYGDGPGQAARRRIAVRIAAAHGLSLETSWPMPLIGVDCFVMRVPEGVSPKTVIDSLAGDPDVVGAEPMQVFNAQGQAGGPASTADPSPATDQRAAEIVHNDPLYRAEPAAKAWRLAELHAVATGRKVRVAVIDSLVDTAHPDLAGQVQTAQDFVLNHPHGPEQHGTAVAGIIAAVADNKIGIAGVAPGARLMALRACWQQPGSAATVCDTLSLAKALYFAVDHNAQIINLSLSGPADPLLGRIIDVALSRGTVVVSAVDPASANGGFPASHPGVVAVSDDPGTTLAGVYSAPGRDIPTTEPAGRFAFVSGSSYAAAHVSGLFALLRERSGKAVIPAALITQRPGGGPIDTCASLLRAAGASCARAAVYPTVARQ